MAANTLYVVLALCSLGHGSVLIPMCSHLETNCSNFPVTLYMNGEDNSSSPVCSCEVQSDSHFYITLKRFRQTSLGTGSFIIHMAATTMSNMTNTSNTVMTYGLDLFTMHNDLGGSDCLLQVGDNTKGLPTQTCWFRNRSSEGGVTLQTPNNLSHDGYLYLSVYGEGSIQFCCKPVQSFLNKSVHIMNSRTKNMVGNKTSPPRAELRTDERRVMTAAIIILGIGCVVLGMAICWLIHRNKQLSQKRHKKARKKISTHTHWKPEAESHYEEMHEDLTKTGNTESTSENVQQLDSEAYELAKAPVPLCSPCNMASDQDSSLYDVASALNSKVVAPSGNVDKKGGAFDTCKPNGKHGHMDSDNIYDKTVFTADSSTPVPASDNGDDVPVSHYIDEHNLTSAVPSSMSTRGDVSSVLPSVSDKKPKKSLDKTTSHSALRLVRQKSVEVRFFESGDLGPEVGMDSPDADMQVSQFINAAHNSTPEVCEEEFENVSSWSNCLDSEDEEIYVNQEVGKGCYSTSNKSKSLEDSQSISSTQGDSQWASLTDNHRISSSPSKPQSDTIRKSVSPSRTDSQLASSPVSCVPENSVFHNVLPASSADSLSSGASQTLDLDNDDMIYQNVALEMTNSTASLLDITSDPEKPYENLKRGQTYVPDSKTPASLNKSDEVEVVFLLGSDSNNAEEEESGAMPKTRSAKIGHKHSFSVDETSKIQRPTRKHRTRSDDTNMLIPSNSSSDEDILEMTNNNLYEGINNSLRATPIKEPASQTVNTQTRTVPLKQLPGPVATSVRSSNEDLGDDSDDEMVMMENDIYECLKGGVSLFPSPLAAQIKLKVECTNPKNTLYENETFAEERP
ncbi:serine-rich adhesin for platelets-like isoform X2 [Haliotis asinina]|uniref:serine-rich adhesin for platelets-like isoform X2 n=1 Tax=Haliotis asinina TaxID=109174 RepID=UPI00353207AD